MATLTFAPSPEQQAVIGYRGGHLQVVACAGAGKTSNAPISPNLSTAMQRLRPLTFFPRVSPAAAALLGCLDRLAVPDHRGRLGLLPGVPAGLLPQGIVAPVPGAVPLLDPEVVADDPVWRQVLGHCSPNAAVVGLLEDAVDHLPTGVLRRMPAGFGFGHMLQRDGYVLRHLNYDGDIATTEAAFIVANSQEYWMLWLRR